MVLLIIYIVLFIYRNNNIIFYLLLKINLENAFYDKCYNDYNGAGIKLMN